MKELLLQSKAISPNQPTKTAVEELKLPDLFILTAHLSYCDVPLKTSAGISRVKGSEFMSSATAMPSVTTPIRRRTCLCLNILTTRTHQGFRRFLNPVPPQDQMTCQRLILISRSPMMHFCLPITKHFLILLQLIHGMYKSILTIVELI